MDGNTMHPDGDATKSSSSGDDQLIEYGIEDDPKLTEAIPLGLQHLLAMFLSTVALPLVIAGAIGLNDAETAFIVQMALLVAGLATIVQVYSIGPVGARLPIVMGTSAIFVAPLINIGATYGVAAIFGAVIVAAPVEIVIGYFYEDLRRLFPPLVTGIVVMLVGLTLIPVAMDYSAGGPGSENFGALYNLGLAGLVFVLAIGLNQYLEGFLSISSILIAVVVGYIVAYPLGLLDLSGVANAAWVEVPMPLEFGLEFHPSAILIAAFAYVIASIETIGDIEGTTGTVGRRATSDEMSGGLLADGVMSMFAGVFNAFPNTSFSQNVGLIGFTGVASRFVVGICGVFLVVLGLIPKVSAVAAAMPDPVLGGAAIVLFGMIFSIGLRIVSNRVELNRRNLTIIAVSVVLGVGVEITPEMLEQLPEDVQVLVGSGLLVGGVAALVLNLVLPGDGGLDGEPTRSTTDD
ncbi:nucleobase:cation symporter-2 family protein [Halostagnicola sp. A-GB9-2]|uniref:uracil-xanthine permease family protein n=1 Tax=Halostagnicola sp. A-GB9-2 TaxID=3048066 RepID=UPI0024C00C20|nr:nucleobase:cation symporter-2 family protein [Halostagnicola sp. A-GB9-2]MDJ1433714.1 nucleobase:cation symporter-2 family protein [Halostagnicola sp. A-GB9-2]